MTLKMRITELVWVKGKDLVPFPENWRKHPTKQVNAFQKLLEEVGFAGAILGRRLPDGRIQALDGHMRSGLLPEDDLPVVLADLNDDEARLIVAGHDAIGMMAKVDRSKLRTLLSSISKKRREALDTNLPKMGNMLAILKNLPSEAEEEDDAPSTGLFPSGKVLVGDCRDLADTIETESVDLVLTDPPSGIGYDKWDVSPEECSELIKFVIAQSERVVKPGGYIFIYQPTSYLRERWQWFPEDSRLFVAAKNFAQIQGVVSFAYDSILFWRKPGDPLILPTNQDWYVANTARTGESRHLEEDAPWHSATKPLDSIVYIVEHFCPPGGTVLDWFFGSGTTGLAAALLDRSYIGIEGDPEHADMAQTRIQMVLEQTNDIR